MTQLNLWPWDHEEAQQEWEDKFIQERTWAADTEVGIRNMRFGFWFGWRHCLKYLRSLEDEQAKMVEKMAEDAPAFDPDARQLP